MAHEFASLFSLGILLAVVLNVMISLMSSTKSSRLGITVLACVCVVGAGIMFLRITHQSVFPVEWRQWWLPVFVLSGAWALWDISLLYRTYGSSTVMSSAEIARGLLLSEKSSDVMWAVFARNLPTAVWMKSKEGNMLCVNRDYEQRYGKLREWYLGNSDGKVWLDSVCDVYRDHDKMVLDSHTPMVFEEPAPIWSDPARTARFLKFPCVDARGEILGVGGIELRPVTFTTESRHV